MKKRFFAALLCLALLAALLPAVAFAAGTGAIQLGADGIAKGDKVYFGHYGGEEVQWIALDGDGFLLSQYTIGSVRFRDCRYYYEAPGPQNPGYYGEDWDYVAGDSQLKQTMDGLYNKEGTTLFTITEQGAVDASVLTPESMDYDGNVLPLTVHLYPLSVMEIYDYAAGEYVIDEALLVTGDITDKLNGNEYGWWTRTNDSETNVVRVGGRDNASPVLDDIRDSAAVRGVRPAFNLNMDSVLFASAAVGGKSVAGMDAGLTAVSVAAPTEWKLTLLDSGRSGFSVTTTVLSSASATVNYSGAKTGANEYISAVILDGSNNVLYYGRLVQLDGTANGETGTVTISIPAGVTLGADTTLKVFNEQFNGDRSAADATLMAYTDYASELKTVTAPANDAPTASGVAIRGLFKVGETLTGNYTYSDTDGDLEGTSTFKWYRSDSSDGFNKAAIAGATAKTYVLTGADEGKYISFEVTPTAAAGTTQGAPVESDIIGTVAPAPVAVTFGSLTANGSATETTTALTLTFDSDVAGLAIDDITVNGATKGTLTKTGTGIYTLTISNITVADGGTVNVAVSKYDFVFTPANKDVMVRNYTPPAAAYTVTYNGNGGGGTMANGMARQGAAFTLPSCTFTAPAGQRFKEWAIGAADSPTRVAANGTHTFTADTTVYAVWETIPPDADPIQYQIIEGQYGEWTQGGTGRLRFTANADYSKLMSVSADNSVIPSDKYTVESGSTIVTLNASYLETLTVGRHTLRVNFTDGYAETYFTINAAVNSGIPATGDNAQPVLWLCMLIAAAGLSVSLVIRCKRQNG